jgi:hypothetical protein
MLRKLCNGARAQCQTQLPDAIMAYRNAVSSVTGYTPFFLYHGRRARIPLSTLLAGAEPPPDLLGNRLATMTEVFHQAQEHTRESRHHNRLRLARKANARAIVVGDTVIVAANEPVTLSAKWDHQFEVTKVRGLTYWVRHQLTNKELKLHRDKLRLVDPNMAWDGVENRPRRQQIHRVPFVAPAEPTQEDQIVIVPAIIAPATESPVSTTPPRAHATTVQCRAEIHAPPPDHLSNIPARDAPTNPPHPAGTLRNENNEVNNGNNHDLIATDAGQDTTQSTVPMTIEPPAYTLRKRNAVGWVINPGDAKKLRIECIASTSEWFSKLTVTHTPTCALPAVLPIRTYADVVRVQTQPHHATTTPPANTSQRPAPASTEGNT